MTDRAEPDERIEVSLMLRPRRPLAELEARLAQPLSREQFAASYGAIPSDIAQVEAFAREQGLEVVEASQPRRTVRLAGRAAEISAAFGADILKLIFTGGYQVPVLCLLQPPIFPALMAVGR